MGFSPRPLIFLHVPKAGGTTLESIVKRQYKGGLVYRFTGARENTDAFRALPEDERARFDLLSGHVNFGIHASLPDPATYITMLRDPVDRVMSFYYFVKRKPNHYMWEHGFHEQMTLREFLEQGKCIELDNFQTRILNPEPDEYLPFGCVTEEARHSALRNLDRFAAIGLTERFDESLEILRHRFGWQDVSYVPLNVTGDRPRLAEIEPETLDLVREVNRHDLALHERAKELFAAQFAAAAADPPLPPQACTNESSATC